MYFNCSQSECLSACFGLYDTGSGLGQIFKNRIEHNHFVENNNEDKKDEDLVEQEEDLSDLYKKSKVIISFPLEMTFIISK